MVVDCRSFVTNHQRLRGKKLFFCFVWANKKAQQPTNLPPIHTKKQNKPSSLAHLASSTTAPFRFRSRAVKGLMHPLAPSFIHSRRPIAWALPSAVWVAALGWVGGRKPRAAAAGASSDRTVCRWGGGVGMGGWDTSISFGVLLIRSIVGG